MAKVFQVDTGGTLTTNLISYYKCEDATDFYGSNNLTNNNSVTFPAGKVNNGASGGTSNTNKSLSLNSNLGISGGACSISVWVKLLTEITAGRYVFVTVSDATTGTGYDVIYYYNAGSQFVGFYRFKQNVSNDGPTSSGALGTTNWNHFVTTYDGTNVRGYLNGTQVGVATAASGNGSGQSSQTILIAGNQASGTGPEDFASAIVDEVGIWSKKLSTQEITDLYNGGSGQTMITQVASSPRRNLLLGVGI